MKLVLIYGAPGVGKLTTAKALAALTGFRLFHNHLAFDLARSIFDFPSTPFGELAQKVRLTAFEAAGRARLAGLISTFVYAAPEDDRFLSSLIEVVGKEEGEVLFVRLHCDAATHEQRVVAPDREAFHKITGVDELRGALRRWNLRATIPFGESLEIDNSQLGPEQVARQIAARLSLPVAET
jgi:hypothetical protein